MMLPCLCFLRMALTYIVPVWYCMNRGSANGAPAGGAFLVDIPNRWKPRTKQQPTGLIAYGTSCRRPVRVLYRPHRSNVSQGRNKKESRQLTLETLFHQVEHCPQQSNPKGSFQILRQIPSTAQHTVDFHSLYFIVDAVEHKILVNDHPTISRVKVVDLAHFRGIA